jgi:5-formyltetrahydrofolate cyclo-ligase
MSSKRDLRIELRSKRRALSPSRQRHSAARLAAHLYQLPALHRAQHIAIYWPNDGEIDPRPFITLAMQRDVQIYLPVLAANGCMKFAAYTHSTALKKNTFGIPEPLWRRGIVKPLWKLDALLMPLVGFDGSGNRLGMGAGFYDRALASVKGRFKQPQCWGLAHSCQQIEDLPSDVWDIPMEGVITERGVIRFSRRR